MPVVIESGGFQASDWARLRVDAQKSLKDEFLHHYENLHNTVQANLAAIPDAQLNLPIDKNQLRSDILTLWVQAEIARKIADKASDNRVSGFNVGASAGVYVVDKNDGMRLIFASGANREDDQVAIANTHAETSALDGLRRETAPVFTGENLNLRADLIVVTASPCGSCRQEIWQHRTSDETLVVIVDDEGEISVNPISKLFPTKFRESKVTLDERIILKAKEAAQKSIRSRYQQPLSLPDVGVVMVIDKRRDFSGSSVGDDAFCSSTATNNAKGKLLLWGRSQYEDISPTISEQIDDEIFTKVKYVLYYFDGSQPPFFPSGKDRQQLNRLPPETLVYMYLSANQQMFEATVSELLPLAFVKS